jgi:hypothetical protein
MDEFRAPTGKGRSLTRAGVSVAIALAASNSSCSGEMEATSNAGIYSALRREPMPTVVTS